MKYYNRAETLFHLNELPKSASVSLSIFPLGRYDNFSEFSYLCDSVSALYFVSRCSVDSLFTFKQL